MISFFGSVKSGKIHFSTLMTAIGDQPPLPLLKCKFDFTQVSSFISTGETLLQPSFPKFMFQTFATYWQLLGLLLLNYTAM